MEIFAPAGNFESLKQAVQHGANCVYLGLNKFNARMAADNFSTDNFDEIIKFCHLFDVKAYLTLNTLIKPTEFKDAVDLAVFAYECGVDGIICTDFGLTSFLAQNLQDCDIVFSTQANIQNAESCMIAKKLGINSVVVSREIDRNTLIDIRKKFPEMNLEYFVQGALCVCVSGQCQLSSSVDCFSGNRGQCKQPCRQHYTAIIDGKPVKCGYLLSTSDLSLIDKICDLNKLGIDRIKIEGRNRRKEYVGQSVSIYNKAIDNKNILHDKVNLKKMFNRGDFTEGYLYTDKTNEIMYQYSQGHKGTECGKIIEIKNNYAIAFVKNATKGDAYKIFRNCHEVGSATCVETLANNKVKLVYRGAIKTNDDLNITTDISLLSMFASFNKKIPINLKVYANADKPLSCLCECKNIKFLYTSDIICQKAIKQPLSDLEISVQLSKLNETHFTISNIIVKSDDIFIPKSKLNEYRRELIEALTDKLLNNKKNPATFKLPSIKKTSKHKSSLAVCISSDEQIDFVTTCDIVIVKPEIYSRDFLNKFDKLNAYYLDLPNFALKSDIETLRTLLANDRIIGICANSLYAIQLAKEYNKKIFLGQGMNIFNDYTANLFGNDINFLYSNELSLNEIKQFKNQCGYIYAEGLNCCMTLAHCPIQLIYNCNCGNCKYKGNIVYKDDLGHKLSIKRKKVSKCYFEVINTHRLSAYKKIDGNHNYFLNLCNFNVNDTKQTVKLYLDLINKNERHSIQFNDKTTNGHLFKSVK